MGFWRRNDEVERELEAARPRPRRELVDGIAAAVTPKAAPRRYSRVAFGLALLTLMAGLFATAGGIGYAASGAAGTVDALSKAVHVQSKPHRVLLSSATAQYGPSSVAKVIAAKRTLKTTHKAVAPKVAQTVKGASLPFTGLSLLPVLALALALVGAGVLLRRRENRA
jgi:hypothetical protein